MYGDGGQREGVIVDVCVGDGGEGILFTYCLCRGIRGILYTFGCEGVGRGVMLFTRFLPEVGGGGGGGREHENCISAFDM